MKEITLTKGMTTIVDDEDYDKFGHLKWYTSTRGYAVRRNRIKGTNKKETQYLHREIVNCPEGMFVDHINGNQLDNRKENLRVCTTQKNMFNRHKQNEYGDKECSSEFKGVSKIKGKEKFEAFISLDGKKLHLGRFDSEVDAAIAYNLKAKELFGLFAKINDIKIYQ